MTSDLTPEQETAAQARAVELCRMIEAKDVACNGRKCEHPGEGIAGCVFLIHSRMFAALFDADQL